MYIHSDTHTPSNMQTHMCMQFKHTQVPPKYTCMHASQTHLHTALKHTQTHTCTPCTHVHKHIPISQINAHILMHLKHTLTVTHMHLGTHVLSSAWVPLKAMPVHFW